VKPPSRTLTTLAFGLMTLNAVLLVFGALAFDERWLLAPAALCGLVAGGVIAAWRWHRRNLAELEAAQPELRRQIEEMRELLRAPKP
jgi:hypothetical protein